MSKVSAPAIGSPPPEELEEELLELEEELLEDELLTSPEEEDELEPTIIPEELELDAPAPLLELDEELVTPLELEEEATSPLEELLLELEELLLELESGFGVPEEELAPLGGGVGLDPPLLHPCKARAPTVNSISARFFKVSLLYVLYL